MDRRSSNAWVSGFTRVVALAGLSCASACAPEPPRYQLGAPCNDDRGYCEGTDAAVQCSAGRWTRYDCDEVCTGEALGCLYFDNSGATGAGCGCTPVESPPSPSNELHCVDAETLLVCDADGCSAFGCAQQCAASAMAPTSLGCHDAACLCTALGSECAPQDARSCDGPAAEVRCEQGRWRSHACPTDCPSTEGDEALPQVCGPLPDGTVGCRCEP